MSQLNEREQRGNGASANGHASVEVHKIKAACRGVKYQIHKHPLIDVIVFFRKRNQIPRNGSQTDHIKEKKTD